MGLDHFEGRTWLGWHHHVTLVTAAHLFVTEQRVAGGPTSPGGSVSFYAILAELQTVVIHLLNRRPYCHRPGDT